MHMSQSRQRLTTFIGLGVDAFMVGATVVLTAGAPLAELLVEMGATVLREAGSFRASFRSGTGSTETEPLGAED